MNKSKKGSAITPDKPVHIRLLIREIEREKENRLNEEDWAFNIQRIKGIAQTRAGRPHTSYYRSSIKDDDEVVERILEAPLPLNEYVSFDDDSDWARSHLGALCFRLEVRLNTLNDERKIVKLVPWSTERVAMVKHIDEAIKLVEFVLNEPTTSKPIIDKWLEEYERKTGFKQNIIPSPLCPPDNHLELKDSIYWTELSQKAEQAINLTADIKGQKADPLIDELKNKFDLTDAEARSIKKVLDEKVASLKESLYWKELEQKACQALSDYISFELTQSKIKKTANLKQWIKGLSKTTDREAEILKKILTERYKNLR